MKLSDLLPWMGMFKFIALALSLFMMAIALVFGGSWWFVEKVVYREMDRRDAHIAGIDQNVGVIGGQLKELHTLVGASSEKVLAQLNEKHGTHGLQLVELKASYDSLSKDLVRTNRETSETKKKVDDSLVEIGEAGAVTNQLKQQEDKLALLDKAVGKADLKVNLIEEMLDLGIAHTAVQQAILSVIGGQKESDDLVTLDLDLLMERKKELTPLILIKDLAEDYNADTKEAMIIAYDELTELKTLGFFLDLDEIKENLPAGILSSQSSQSGSDEIVDEIMSQPSTIVDVCARMQSVPEVGCYEYFLKWANQDDKKRVGSGGDISSATDRAIELKFAEKINEEIALQTE